MKKVYFILLLFSAIARGQTGTPQVGYVTSTIANMKLYFGNANRVHVDETNGDYDICTVCTANETTIYAGAGGRKWKRVTDSTRVSFSTLADSLGGSIYYNQKGGGIPAITTATNNNLKDTIVLKTFKAIGIGMYFENRGDTLLVGHVGSSTSPSVSVGVGAGTGGTATILRGKDNAFSVRVVAGTSPSTGVIATITPGTAFNATRPILSLVCTNISYTNGRPTYSSGNVVVNADFALTSGFTYEFDVVVIDY